MFEKAQNAAYMIAGAFVVTLMKQGDPERKKEAKKCLESGRSDEERARAFVNARASVWPCVNGALVHTRAHALARVRLRVRGLAAACL